MKITAAVLILLAISGCAGHSQPAFRQHYTLVGANAPAPAKTPPSAAVLRLAPIAVADWLDNTSIYYRLRYLGDNRIRDYSRAAWVAPPAAMLTTLVENTLAGHWGAVLAPDDVATADFTLSLRLTDLEQNFTDPADSDCRLRVIATLVDSLRRAVVAQRDFRYTAAAPSPDAAGAVACARANAARFAGELGDWLTHSAPEATAQ